MAFDSTSADDAAALMARQARVRALSLRIAEAVEAIPLPESFLDGERAARAIIVADRMLVRLPEPDADAAEAEIHPARLRLRRFADRVFAVIEDMPRPQTFLDGERAGRCVLATGKLFDQLYAPVKPAKSTPDDSDIDAVPERPRDETTDAINARLFEDVDRLTAAHARDCGFYPDGSVCDPAAPPDYARLSAPQEDRLMAKWLAAASDTSVPPEDSLHLIAQIMTLRANASTRAQARASGAWPDGKPFRDNDRPFWAISQAFPAVIMQRPGPSRADLDEAPGPGLFPWWIVRNPDSG